jgi:hypothetical protein
MKITETGLDPLPMNASRSRLIAAESLLATGSFTTIDPTLFDFWIAEIRSCLVLGLLD